MSDIGFMMYVMTCVKTLSRLQNNSNHTCHSCHSHNLCLTSWKILLNKGVFVVFLARQPPVDQGLLIYDASQSVGLLWTDLYLTTQQTNIHAPGGIRTHNLSRQAAADQRLRPRCHWDQLTF
jgi:hypothetical protein